MRVTVMRSTLSCICRHRRLLRLLKAEWEDLILVMRLERKQVFRYFEDYRLTEEYNEYVHQPHSTAVRELPDTALAQRISSIRRLRQILGLFVAGRSW